MSEALFEPWRPRASEWDRAAAQHLYRRAGFGARPEELDRALSEGLEATLARVFADRTSPELLGSIQPLLPAGELELLQAWWMSLILDGGSPLRERMTLVWHDHFATSNDKVGDVRMMHAQNELFRAQGLGDFRALLKAVARDPAMLRWLDGDSNRSGHANENFARELMELFALGLGNYGERDVQEAARAFSGWGISGRTSVFQPEHHDDGEKTLFGRTGRFGCDDVLDLVLEQPACAHHVARVLLEAFVLADPPADWVAELARVLHETDWDVGRTLRTLLSSRLFFSAAARRARIAGPVELVAVATRSIGARIAPLRAARWASGMGQSLFRPPSVKGWDGGRAWIHAGAWIARHNAFVELVKDAAREDELERFLDSAEREAVPASALGRLLPDGAGQAFTEALGRAARNAHDVAEARETVVALVLTSPEFQLF
jgi:uncharacterized protein (DUF1800 family)